MNLHVDAMVVARVKAGVAVSAHMVLVGPGSRVRPSAIVCGPS